MSTLMRSLSKASEHPLSLPACNLTQQQRVDYMNAEFIKNHGRVQEKFHRLDWFPIGRALRGADIFCPVCWILHSTALDIEPSPNPLFCNVKFNPIEDQSTVLFRIIKSFTTKSVNLRFVLIFFLRRGTNYYYPC